MTENFFTVVERAVADISEHGFDTEGRVEFWMGELRKAAAAHLMPEHEMAARLRDALGAIYGRLVEKGQYARYHPGIAQFTVDRLRPHLRAELDRRILASANLIKLNRVDAIEATLRRFQGWSSSVPRGGERDGSRSETGKAIKKSLKQLPFESRRVIIDQGMKLTSSINSIIATDGGAIAARWRSHAGELNYKARPEHAARNNHVYLIRDSWAYKAGLVKPGRDGYTDQITQPAQEIFCRCWYVYLYSLGALEKDAPDMITLKGHDELAKVRA